MYREHDELTRELDSMGTALEEIREPWIPLWKTLADFCESVRQFYAPEDEGKSKEPKTLYNSKGVLALNTTSQAFQGYTANSYSQWFKLTFADPLLIRQPGVADWLEDVERIMYSIFQRCGLYEALGELSPDAHGIGTAYLYTEEDVGSGRMIYQCRHPRSIYIAENAAGEVDTLIEDAYMTNKAAKNRFDDRLTSRLSDDAQRKPYSSSIIKHYVIPMDERYRSLGRRDINPEMPFLSLWYDKAEHKVLDAGGYWEFPYMVHRRAKNSGEVYGRSEAMNALGDIKGLCQITKSTLRLAQLISDPTYVADEDLEGRDTIVPGGRIYTTKAEQRFEALQLGANYPIGVDREERVERAIDDHFNVPLYLMMQRMEGPRATAQEIIERAGEKAAVLGYMTGRYNSEVLAKVVRRTFNVLFRAGRLPKPPRIVFDAKTEGGLDIVFQGLLAQMQQRHYQTNGINASLAYIQAVGGIFGSEALDNVESDELMREGLESAGCPAKIIRELPSVEQRRALRAQAQAQAQQQAMAFEQQQAIVQNADKLGQRPQSGSPLEQMDRVTA